jgi:two-component system nitrate/nitrite response regulator NarL
MITQHLFLTSAVAPVPDRWRQAFLTGQVFNASALLTRLREQSSAQCLVWLSSADAQWPVYLVQILQAEPGTRVVLLSGMPDPLEGLNALNQGVRGYTHAYGVPALLQEVAQAVEHGGLWVGRDLLQRLVGASTAALAERAKLDKTSVPVATTTGIAPLLVATPVTNGWALLSVREAQVARAVAVGRSNREVADLLFISERTVKAHLSAVFEKIGVRDRLQLVLRLAASADLELAPIDESLA